jgi:hypothetical protein
MMYRSVYALRGLLIATTVVFLPASVQPQGSKRESLRGIKALAVVIEDLSPDTEQAGFQKTQLKNDVEMRLKGKGIRLVSEPETAGTWDGPILNVRLQTVKHDRQNIEAISIILQLRQKVRLTRESGAEVLAVTWQSDRLGSVDKAELPLARKILVSMVDGFISDYSAVNPL